ncbi:hypothetical protein BJ912DRAFT_1022052 [Pholiota molesta]|nr:hypothetical protein BJ912DRAFT_1022052 [Pholiota molesta]
MSCLLFNLAIESLATQIRESDLKGFNLPGQIDRLITTLFADDTSVYLSEGDSFQDLTSILNKWDEKIPQNIRIVEEGDHARMLGAYIGNNTNAVSIWTPILEKIDENLARWAKGNPTQEGRRLIINMEVGGRTQYLTRVQGMPTESKPMIKADTLKAAVKIGGRKLLDIQARNEAIELRRYQRYCALGENRPRWAYILQVLKI